MDNGIELIGEADVQAQLRRQARRVYLKAILAAGLLTLLYLGIPARW